MATAATLTSWSPGMCSGAADGTPRTDLDDRLEQFFRKQDQQWEDSSARLCRMESVLRQFARSSRAWPTPSSPRSGSTSMDTEHMRLRLAASSMPLPVGSEHWSDKGAPRQQQVALSPTVEAAERKEPAERTQWVPASNEGKVQAPQKDSVLAADVGGNAIFEAPVEALVFDDAPATSTHRVALYKMQHSQTAKKLDVQKRKGKDMAADLALAKRWQKTEGGMAPRPSLRKDLPWYRQEDARIMNAVRHPLFDVAVASLIFANTLIIGFEVDREVKGLSRDPHIETFGVVLAMLFGLELVLRIAGERLTFFRHPHDYGWNWFDLCVVGFSFIDLILKSALAGAADVSFLRLLRVVRCARVIRVFRLSGFFRELRLMIFLIFCSFKSLMWVFVLLSMVIYIFAVIFTKGAAEEIYHDDHDNVSDENLVLYYGSLFDSMLTLLKAAFGGADWGDLLEPLWHCSVLYVFIFIAFEAFMLLAVLNIVTGVFVQNTMESAKKDMDLVIQDELEAKNSVLAELRALFQEVESAQEDEERTPGEISEEAFDQLLEQDRMLAYFGAVGIEVSEAKGLFRLLDADSSGRVNAEEFAMGCMRIRGEAKTVDVITLMYENKRMIQTITNVISEMHMEYHAIMAEVYTAERMTLSAEKASMSSLEEIKRIEQLSTGRV